MRKGKILAAVLAVTCTALLLSGCGFSGDEKNTDSKSADNSSDHPVITMNAPYRNMSTFVDIVKEKYPEINLEVIPYNGQNTSTYMLDMRKTGEMPDIYFTTYYLPGRYDDKADFLDLSGYDFTGDYVQSRLREVTLDGGIYMLPMGYNALGITYNKTLLDKNGWKLPTSFKELEELAPKVEEAGYTLCLDQLQYPGFGFQFLCNIADTGFLSTIDGLTWQEDFLNGDANVSDTPEMVKAVQSIEKWRDLGMLNANGTPDSDSDTKAEVLKGNTLFLMGNSNDLTAENDATDEYRLMPYLSEDGDQNVFILNVSRYVGLNKELGEKGNEQKLEDAMHVMEVLSTVEGMESMDPSQNNSRIIPLKDAKIEKDSYYSDILDELNSGHTASFVYSGWENIVVPVGETMIEYIKGNASVDDIIKAFDDNQSLITENEVDNYTTVTETLDMDTCAKLVGICFAKAVNADAALISTNPWLYDKDAFEMNQEGVSGALFPMGVSDQEIVSILPTGWSKNIQTVTLTGKRIKELMQTGYERSGNSVAFPYVLAAKDGMEFKDDTTYTIVICGATDEVQEEGNIQDSGVLGLDAAKEYLSQFETLSAKDIVWE
ncbi:ABC transporter substrate-binding protein [Blautia sp. MSJ-9]|uniref:ABC transporter substrate-binding protein n=1 Tax=Blautia sp. MSJ-9 TaxID=2841511 RepID=UPI001C126827|nr:ABC transporter substrate-binding protein [Blautia sp. MSJ-9]MBU5678992.1 ABC transporter substrate-binding protein [Blautia sp. MSJ-9]